MRYVLFPGVVAALILGAPLLHAQAPPAGSFTVFPPPALNAPRLTPRPLPASAHSARAPVAGQHGLVLPDLPQLSGGMSTDGRGQVPPTVNVSRHKGQVVEQYYEGGQLIMVQVRPKHGVPYTYFVQPGRKLTRSPGAPPVTPVLYTLLKWDRSAPAGDNGSR